MVRSRRSAASRAPGVVDQHGLARDPFLADGREHPGSDQFGAGLGGGIPENGPVLGFVLRAPFGDGGQGLGALGLGDEPLPGGVGQPGGEGLAGRGSCGGDGVFQLRRQRHTAGP